MVRSAGFSLFPVERRARIERLSGGPMSRQGGKDYVFPESLLCMDNDMDTSCGGLQRPHRDAAHVSAIKRNHSSVFIHFRS